MTNIDSNVIPMGKAALLVGRSAPAVHALRHLEALGVGRLKVFSDRVASDLLDVAGRRLVHRLPSPAEIEQSVLLMIADLPPALAAPLVTAAHAAGVPVEHHQATQRIAPAAAQDEVTAFSEPCLIYAF